MQQFRDGDELLRRRGGVAETDSLMGNRIVTHILIAGGLDRQDWLLSACNTSLKHVTTGAGRALK